MKVERDPNRFKKMYPDKKIVLPKDYSEKLECVIYSSVGTFKLKVKDKL